MSPRRVGLNPNQQVFLRWIAAGKTRDEARLEVGVSVKTFDSWRGQTDFRRGLDEIEAKTLKQIPKPPGIVPFRKHFFGHDTPPHQQEWFYHLMMGCCKNLLVLTYPESGKSTAIARDFFAYVFAEESYRHHNNIPYVPERVAYISSNTNFSQDVGWQLRRTLTDVGEYSELIDTYGPFKAESGSEGVWSARAIMMPWRNAAEKEPSMQWVGIGNQIQGRRLTWAVLDDCDTPQMGAADRKSILRTLRRVILQRLGTEGRLLVIGNRVDEDDIYTELLENAEAAGWHVIIQNALDNEGNPTWDRYTAEYFASKRASMTDRDFNLLYMNQVTPGEDAWIKPEVLDNCKKPRLGLNEVPDGHHMVFASLDPAPSGPWAAMRVSYSKAFDSMRILDIRAGRGGGYEAMRDAVIWGAGTFPRPAVFGIEHQGQNALMTTPEIDNILTRNHCRFEPLKTTGQGVLDQFYGMNALALWLEKGKIEIPWSPEAQKTMAPLISELLAYSPDPERRSKRQAYDRVMAMWFCFRMMLLRGRYGNIQPFVEHDYAPSYLLERRQMVDLDTQARYPVPTR